MTALTDETRHDHFDETLLTLKTIFFETVTIYKSDYYFVNHLFSYKDISMFYIIQKVRTI